MKQAISGETPSQVQETSIMTVWPSVAAYGLGRFLGRLYSIRWPDISFLRIGNLFALLSIPLALGLYFYRLKPSFFGIALHGTAYRLTNRRIVEIRNEIRSREGFPWMSFVFGAEVKAVELDRFDSITVVVRNGQEWYHAGDLVFRLGNVETFRLAGVSRPEAFRQTCLKAHFAYVGVKQALAQQAPRETALV